MEIIRYYPKFKLSCDYKNCLNEVIYTCKCYGIITGHACLGLSCSEHIFSNTILHNKYSKQLAQWSRLPDGYVEAKQKQLDSQIWYK